MIFPTQRRHGDWDRKTALTLVEVLVVIAVLGVLAALILPAFSAAKKKALLEQCVNNVLELDAGVHMFVDDNHAYPFYNNGGFGRGDDSYFAAGPDWHSSIQNVIYPRNPAGLGGVWWCPSARRPSDWPEHAGFEYYGYNAWGLHFLDTSSPNDGAASSLGLGGRSYPPPLAWTPEAVKESEVLVPSEMIAIGDAFRGNDGLILDGVGLDRERPKPQLPGARTYDLATSTQRSYARHQGKAVIGFCDGHTESLSLNALFTDTNDIALSRWNLDHQPHGGRLSH